ncbi:group III truncated hemoglobin [Neisseriaceae bacterium JH1-16]|nr:group III truncated hemoglobin [Neisseriaceae bacterium JH1-16]
MTPIADEIGRERIAAVVARFYRRVRVHPTLAAPFDRVSNWTEHEAKLTHFWWTTLGGARYRDEELAVGRTHMEVGVTPALLADWLSLFRATLAEEPLSDELLLGWLERAERIGRSLLYLAQFDAEERAARRAEVRAAHAAGEGA